jgi:hypothetical protein
MAGRWEEEWRKNGGRNTCVCVHERTMLHTPADYPFDLRSTSAHLQCKYDEHTPADAGDARQEGRWVCEGRPLSESVGSKQTSHLRRGRGGVLRGRRSEEVKKGGGKQASHLLKGSGGGVKR